MSSWPLEARWSKVLDLEGKDAEFLGKGQGKLGEGS